MASARMPPVLVPPIQSKQFLIGWPAAFSTARRSWIRTSPRIPPPSKDRIWDKGQETVHANNKSSEYPLLNIVSRLRISYQFPSICFLKAEAQMTKTTADKTDYAIRMHSSRMRTTRLLTVSPSMHGAFCHSVHREAGCLPPPPPGRHPASLWTEWQTGVKTLPCRIFVAGGNYVKSKF